MGTIQLPTQEAKASKSLPEKPKTKRIKPTSKPVVTVSANELEMNFATRRYRVRGLEHNPSPQQLRVNILAVREELVYLDTLDLYQARSRASFIKGTAHELLLDPTIIKRDLGQLLLELESLQQSRLENATAKAQLLKLHYQARRVDTANAGGVNHRLLSFK